MRARIAATFAMFLLASVAGKAAADGLARVTYVTGSTAYVDAGTGAGLRVGAVVNVRRSGQELGDLVVTAASSRRASLELRGAEFTVQVGDAVRFTPADAPPAPPAVSTSTASGSDPPTRRDAQRLRGRLGLRYVGLMNHESGSGGYSEPGLDARVKGALDENWFVHVDVRARRTLRTDADDDGRTRVYRLSGEWRSGDTGPRVVLGRQFSTSLASVSLFDGVRAEYRGRRWAVGAFSGTEPGRADWEWSTDVRQHGAFTEWSGTRGESSRWTMTLAAVGSYEEGEIDREFAALQGRWIGPRVTSFVVQEVDLNRDWKRDAGEEAVSWTSAQAGVQVRLDRAWTVDGGFDSRRRVRTYRDRETPETAFDDEHRRGAWGGVTWRPNSSWRTGLSARRTDGGSAGEARLFTWRGQFRLARLRSLSASARTTFYRNDLYDGRLESGRLSLAVTDRVDAAIGGGHRAEEHRVTAAKTDSNWISADVDVVLSGGWYAATSVERTGGDGESVTQVYSSVVWRF